MSVIKMVPQTLSEDPSTLLAYMLANWTYSYLLSFAKLGYKARSLGHPVRIEVTNNGLLIQLVNHCTTWGAFAYWAYIGHTTDLIGLIGLVGRVFAKWSVRPRFKRWYLKPPCLTLSIIRCVSRMKWSNPGNGVAHSPTPSYWKQSLRVTLDYGL